MRDPVSHNAPAGVRWSAANGVTAIRAGLAAVIATALWAPMNAGVLWTVIAAAVLFAVLDGVDGWLARRTNSTSTFGARFDLETDAAFILVLSVLVWQNEKAGVWVLLCGLMRYAFIAAGWIVPWMRRPLRSTRRGKTVAVLQFAGLSTALAPIVVPPLSAVLAAATLAALVWSFAVDVVWLARSADGGV
jgi:phosphatidylglycerophosphate synthase